MPLFYECEQTIRELNAQYATNHIDAETYSDILNHLTKYEIQDIQLKNCENCGWLGEGDDCGESPCAYCNHHELWCKKEADNG